MHPVTHTSCQTWMKPYLQHMDEPELTLESLAEEEEPAAGWCETEVLETMFELPELQILWGFDDSDDPEISLGDGASEDPEIPLGDGASEDPEISLGDGASEEDSADAAGAFGDDVGDEARVNTPE